MSREKNTEILLWAWKQNPGWGGSAGCSLSMFVSEAKTPKSALINYFIGSLFLFKHVMCKLGKFPIIEMERNCYNFPPTNTVA